MRKQRRNFCGALRSKPHRVKKDQIRYATKGEAATQRAARRERDDDTKEAATSRRRGEGEKEGQHVHTKSSRRETAMQEMLEMGGFHN